jgi:hypothetical protein
MRMLRRNLSRRHGGAEGELRAGSLAMRELRLVFESGRQEFLAGGEAGDDAGDSPERARHGSV